jgi:hypothetical protein
MPKAASVVCFSQVWSYAPFGVPNGLLFCCWAGSSKPSFGIFELEILTSFCLRVRHHVIICIHWAYTLSIDRD